jgi:predicted Zn-dependent peptidase
MKKTKKTKPWTVSKLPNGLRYMFIPRPEMMSATAMVLVRTGSEYESKKQNGLAHFLEHMCFKGTIKRPNSLVISKEFEILGAQYNAFTSGEYTGYYGKGQSSDTGLLLDICADIFLNSTFPESEIEKEKGVVIEEINMYEDDPQSKVGLLIDELMYGDQPGGRQIIGTKQTVSSFTRQDILDYHKNNYTPENTLVVVAGNFDKKKIEVQIKKTFGKMIKHTPPVQPKTIVDQKEPAIKIFNKKSEQTHIILSFHAYDRFNPKKRTARMLANILGKGMASRLFHLLREKLGVCYYVSASAGSGNDTGYFSVRAGLANDKVVQTLTEIVKELKKIKKELVPTEEINRVKKSVTAGSRIALETSDSYADHFGFQELFGMKIDEVQDSVKKYQKITREEVKEIAKEIFVPEKANLAIVGPHENQAELLKILKNL